jgi:hypothetical protein
MKTLKNTKVISVSFLFSMIALLTTISCYHDPVNLNDIPSVCFDSLVYPLLQISCGIQGCHGSGSNDSDFSVKDYNSVMEAVSPYNPRASKLYQVITDINSDEMMPPGQPLTLEQRSIIEIWIAQGATKGTCVPDTNSICFVQDILPMILSNCGTQGCHDAVTHAEGYILTDYNSIMEGIRPYKPGSSKIYEVVTESGEDKMPPYPLQPLTSSQISALREWIVSGAENSDCPETVCDTLGVISFTSQVNPVIQSSCFGCHNPSQLSGGVDLSGYSHILTYAQTLRNGTPVLTGVIRKLSGFQPMPPSYSLDECTIRKIELWIENGAANN